MVTQGVRIVSSWQELAGPGSLLAGIGEGLPRRSKYLYAGLEETGIDDTDFRILEALLNKDLCR